MIYGFDENLYLAFKNAVKDGSKTGYFLYKRDEEDDALSTVFYHFPDGMIEFHDAGIQYHNEYKKTTSWRDVLFFEYGVSLYKFIFKDDVEAWMEDFITDSIEVGNEVDNIHWVEQRDKEYYNELQKYQFDNKLLACPYYMGHMFEMDFPNIDALPDLIDIIINFPVEKMVKIQLKGNDDRYLYRTYETLGENVGGDMYVILRETYRNRFTSHVIENTHYQLSVTLANEEARPTEMVNTLTFRKLKDTDLLLLRDAINQFIGNAFKTENDRIDRISEFVLLPGYWMERKDFLEDNIKDWANAYPEYTKRSMLPKLMDAYKAGSAQIIQLTNKEYAEMKGWYFSDRNLKNKREQNIIKQFLNSKPDHKCYEFYLKTKDLSIEKKVKHIMDIHHLKNEEQLVDFLSALTKHK